MSPVKVLFARFPTDPGRGYVTVRSWAPRGAEIAAPGGRKGRPGVWFGHNRPGA